MAIRYLDGTRLQRIFIAAANWVNARKEHLNAINVFPVPDGDAGSNMAATLNYGVDGIAHLDRPTLDEVRDTLGQAVLVGARGNSGFIIAQFMRGFLDGVGEGKRRVHRDELARACREAFRKAYDAIVEPVEGTILTVMREWSKAITNLSREPRDLGSILDGALERARLALAHTKEQMALLKEHGVVDAGAQGFVHMLEGISEFIRSGSLHPEHPVQPAVIPAGIVKKAEESGTLAYRYCTQVLIGQPEKEAQELIALLEGGGDSIIVSGGEDLLKVHIHTNTPDIVIASLSETGKLLESNVEDMQLQSEVMISRRRKVRPRSAKQTVGIVMDSTCDLPLDQAAEAGIQIVPCLVAFGEDVFRDKVNLSTDQFYQMLLTHPVHPLTSQPAIGDMESTYESALAEYDHVLSIHLSKKLSGTYQAAVQAAKEVDPERITVVDSETLTVSMGLMGLQIARRAREGMGVEELVHRLGEMGKHSRLYCLLETLECLIKGGRVSKLRGWVGQTLGLLPLITVQDGMLVSIHRVRNSEKGFEDIFRRLSDEIPEGTPVMGAVAHGNNPDMAERIREEFTRRFSPVEIMCFEIGPAVGAHAGPGAWGINYMAADIA